MDDSTLGICRNPRCVLFGCTVGLHPSGLCFACCPKYGPLGCEDCRPEDEDDDVED